MKTSIASLYLLLLFSSFRCERGCETINMPFSFTELLVVNLDNAGAIDVRSESNEVLKEAFGMSLILNTDITNELGYCSEYIPLDSIINIRVYTLNDFDIDKPLGADITDYFLELNNAQLSGINNYTASKYFKLNDREFKNHPNIKVFKKEIIKIFLAVPPTESNKHQFKVEIELSNHKMFSVISPEVILL